ncbi:helix-turn-helix domain-containing protein [Serratia marcescens]|nr:helix-turn-helix domain-containing protein [Serratia marcescens]
MNKIKAINFSHHIIEAVIVWIHENIDKRLRIDDLSQFSGYSKWHLQRLFTKHTGKTIANYIRSIRLQLAAKDLINTKDTVLDISLRYGFESQQNFTKSFSREFNTPPGNYRKLHSTALKTTYTQGR